MQSPPKVGTFLSIATFQVPNLTLVSLGSTHPTIPSPFPASQCYQEGSDPTQAQPCPSWGYSPLNGEQQELVIGRQSKSPSQIQEETKSLTPLSEELICAYSTSSPVMTLTLRKLRGLHLLGLVPAPCMLRTPNVPSTFSPTANSLLLPMPPSLVAQTSAGIQQQPTLPKGLQRSEELHHQTSHFVYNTGSRAEKTLDFPDPLGSQSISNTLYQRETEGRRLKTTISRSKSLLTTPS